MYIKPRRLGVLRANFAVRQFRTEKTSQKTIEF
jgi:hypothetical protein